MLRLAVRTQVVVKVAIAPTRKLSELAIVVVNDNGVRASETQTARCCLRVVALPELVDSRLCTITDGSLLFIEEAWTSRADECLVVGSGNLSVVVPSKKGNRAWGTGRFYATQPS